MLAVLLIMLLPAVLMILLGHHLFNKRYDWKHIVVEYAVGVFLINGIVILAAWLLFGNSGSVVENIITYRSFAWKYMMLALCAAAGIPLIGKWEQRYHYIRSHKYYVLILAVCVLTELFIFNGKSFQYRDSDTYQQKTYALSDVSIDGFSRSGDKLIYDEESDVEASLTLSEIGTHVGTLFLDVAASEHTSVACSIYYTDDANQYFYRQFSVDIVNGLEESCYYACYLNGEVDGIRIIFTNLNDGEEVELRSIALNDEIPVHFHSIRVLLLFLIVSGIYAVRNSTFLAGALKDDRYQQKRAAVTALSVLIFLLIAWILYTNSVESVTIYNQDGNDVYVQLTDALLSGRTYIDAELSEEFLALENPYDASERLEAGLYRYQWDHAYYDGHFYIYYGVVPAILFFIPFKLVTGQYLSTAFITFLLMVVYIVVLDLLLYRIFRHVLPDLNFGGFLLAMLTVDAATCVLPVISNLSWYVLTFASGLALVSTGLYILCCWMWGKRSRKKLFAGSLCMALAVGCRPTMVFYSLLLVPFAVRELFLNKEKGLGRCLDIAMPLVIAYLIVALPLMYYNYIRFGSVVEFGQSYQLTVSNMQYEGNQIASIPWCIWLGMFEPFSISADFPFITYGSTYSSYNGYFYNGGNGIAMFSMIPLLWGMFVPSFWKEWRNRQGRFRTMSLLYVLIIGWITAIFVFCSAGLQRRYTMEALPIMTIAVCFLFCGHLEHHSESRKEWMSVYAALTMFSLYAAFAFGMNGEENLIYKWNPVFYAAVERIFCFWL